MIVKKKGRFWICFLMVCTATCGGELYYNISREKYIIAIIDIIAMSFSANVALVALDERYQGETK